MKLLVSPTDEKEALEAIAGGADIVDVKNPKEGTLGASFPWIIKRVREITPKNIEVSCTIGDLPNLPGTAALSALGAATLGVSYIKAGLYGVKNKDEAVVLMKNITRAVKAFDASIKVVATGYADAERISAVDPLLVPVIAHIAECDVAMVDTAVKDGKTLLDFLHQHQLQTFIDEAHTLNLKVALAGSVKKEHLPLLYKLGTDIVGVRGAACTNGDRKSGQITRQRVRELVQTLHAIESNLSGA
ncbi:MAG: (5-formylfuran-3-yl)methyl phosphate synthase [Candidatus Bathyarchaeota archaeon]|nr:(5-formylfuran-3-yl)methyl phosphate synthase [Candidatus Bathyarchaeota archaeon]